MDGLEDGLADQDDGEDDHEDGGDPGDDVEEERVGVLSHQVFAIDQQEDEDDHDGEPDTVAYLGEDENFPERRVGDHDESGADYDQDGVEPVESGGFAEFVVDARFEAEAFANDVRGGKRKNGGGEQRSIEKTESEGVGSELPASGTRALAASPRR